MQKIYKMGEHLTVKGKKD